MCSTPKGRSPRSNKHPGIQSLTEEMSADEYTDLVQRANYSYEHRQQELKRLRAEGKLPPSKLRQRPEKHQASMLQCLLNLDFPGFFRKLSTQDSSQIK
jgi:hypothetical protein